MLSLLAVGLGLGLGLGVGARAVGPARAVAAVAAIAAIVLQLLPEALHDLGWVALVAFAVAASLPLALELGGRRFTSPTKTPWLSFEVAYAALVVHQLADGVAIGSLASVHHDHGHHVSYVAIAVHTVALVALFVLLARGRFGRVSGLLRGVGLAVALVVGAAAVGLLPVTWIQLAHPWVIAAAGGALLHVALHPLVELLRPRPVEHAR